MRLGLSKSETWVFLQPTTCEVTFTMENHGASDGNAAYLEMHA